jgi:predicted choloylglycine hydrolase
MQFGRDEGLNEHGLGITMSSCGFPVGTPENMRRPGIRGLQFWAVIRTLLENCKDTDEALEYIKGMPIAFNINMLFADAKGNIALVETLDGRVAVKKGDGTEFLHATNHAVLPEMKQYEKTAMRNSVQRYDTIKHYIEGAKMGAEQIKTLQLKKYPEGLCCLDFDGFFGTTKSIVMDVTDGKLSICWGGSAENGWKSYSVREPLPFGTQKIKLTQESVAPGFFDMVTI